MNLASFVTTYMEDEAEKLMAENLSKNFIDYEEYPQTAEICVSVIYECCTNKQKKKKREGEQRRAVVVKTV